MAIALRTLRVAADLDRLAEIRAFIREAAASADAPIDCLDDLVQAVDEAATNAIVHGYRGRPGWLEVTVGFDGQRFVVTIADEAPPFDPTSYPEPDLAVPPERRKPGGMGVHLIRAATDELSWQARRGGGNILTLIRARAARQQEE
jgi:anti-sigma regulatory factor (Ser/Thr protein kinase)